ncbi:SDR family NAD(P)-dependent oxidoreductase [Allokutzneria albata]|uniref:Short-chain dehydrogenase n=1 Tax=Allokutzneria albata TaxID=211114 RepID=A0A1G9RWT5_ALLAB|nr:SDR family NAD(P)-dependent oxidoreductase [Allokutzneria albata]SDM27480.1 Short-chain dehydrogenase [Allokutzneria albata]
MTTTSKPLAVVTGASGGIGLELAKVFARNGFDLVVAAEDAGILAAARELQGLGAAAEAVRVDLARFDGVEELALKVKQTGRPVAALAVNAGVGVGGPFAGDTDLQAQLDVVNLNVTSAVHLTKRVLPWMAERGEGRVLFTSSIAATMPGPFQAVYAASKAFLASFSQALREEVKDSGVTVTALLPGPTETDFFRRAGMTDTKVGSGPKDDPADVARQGFEAMMAGKDHVVAASITNKAEAVAARVLSDPVKARMHRKLAEPQEGSP